jgi:outer membrane lipoprotein-sorting protein
MRWPTSSSPRRPVRRHRRAGRVVWLALLAAVPVRAACDSTASCLKAIEAAQANARSVSARFTQTKHLSLLDEPLVSTGRFMFKRPDRVRLDIESPRAATIVINGREISIPGISERDKQQLDMTPMASMFSELGSMFGGSTSALRQHFQVAATPVDGAIEVTLTPTVPAWQRLFRTIQLRFAEPDLVLSAMRLDDALGDRLDIVMSDVQRNPDLPDTLFTIEPTPAP